MSFYMAKRLSNGLCVPYVLKKDFGEIETKEANLKSLFF